MAERRKTGWCAMTEERREYIRQWREAHREELAARRRAAYAVNKEKEQARQRAMRAANPEYWREYHRNYDQSHPKRRFRYLHETPETKAHRKAYRDAHKAEFAARAAAWDAVNHERRRLRHNERQATDINYRLRRTLRSRLVNAVRKSRDGYKEVSAVRDLGCSIEELRMWLENQFLPGMSWDNYGSEWSIDHIRELVLFDLTDPAEQRRACHYTNLQPLWRSDNISKGARVRWARQTNGAQSQGSADWVTT